MLNDAGGDPAFFTPTQLNETFPISPAFNDNSHDVKAHEANAEMLPYSSPHAILKKFLYPLVVSAKSPIPEAVPDVHDVLDKRPCDIMVAKLSGLYAAESEPVTPYVPPYIFGSPLTFIDFSAIKFLVTLKLKSVIGNDVYDEGSVPHALYCEYANPRVAILY